MLGRSPGGAPGDGLDPVLTGVRTSVDLGAFAGVFGGGAVVERVGGELVADCVDLRLRSLVLDAFSGLGVVLLPLECGLRFPRGTP